MVAIRNRDVLERNRRLLELEEPDHCLALAREEIDQVCIGVGVGSPHQDLLVAGAASKLDPDRRETRCDRLRQRYGEQSAVVAINNIKSLIRSDQRYTG